MLLQALRSLRAGAAHREPETITVVRQLRITRPRDALRRWLRRKGAKPAALIEMSKSLHGAERAIRNALEIVL